MRCLFFLLVKVRKRSGPAVYLNCERRRDSPSSWSQNRQAVPECAGFPPPVAQSPHMAHFWNRVDQGKVPVEYVSKVKGYVNSLIAAEYMRRNQPCLFLFSEDESHRSSHSPYGRLSQYVLLAKIVAAAEMIVVAILIVSELVDVPARTEPGHTGSNRTIHFLGRVAADEAKRGGVFGIRGGQIKLLERVK
ncbi:hypothetical protein GWK47_014477 [Chionoecetes opilio]|uniref:Uncharacterized protein n=1 Tax=Chionoecetes opilio TaxID=41210 RepID=A0A8J4Y3P0_CHIOP|nr:hypothetical protein GWK47_014477 [Chionoecetes opilio]